MKPGHFNPARGLWWTALILILLGAGLAYAMRMTNEGDPTAGGNIRLVVAATILASGLCVIAATARWWMQR